MGHTNLWMLQKYLLNNVIRNLCSDSVEYEKSYVPNVVPNMVENSSLGSRLHPVEPDAEDRFDPQVAINLLIEIARTPSLDAIMKTLKRFLLTRPGIARTR